MPCVYLPGQAPAVTVANTKLGLFFKIVIGTLLFWEDIMILGSQLLGKQQGSCVS